jgi:Amt family ammonium transporter
MAPLLAAALTVLGALLIRAGYAATATALVRSKNSAGTVTRHLMDAAVATLAFWAIGWAIASSPWSVLGLRPGAMFGISREWSVPASAIAAILIGAGVLPGVLAERARFWPALIATAVTAALILPIADLWRHGWLGRIGYRDTAGAGFLHLTAAVAAAVAARFVGPRTGKFNRDGSSTAIPGHSVPLAGVGAFLQLIGFVAFAGAASGENFPRAAGNILLAAAAGGLAAALLSQSRYYKPDCHLITTGVLGALVAICAGPDTLLNPFAVLIGVAAGVLVPLAVLTIDLRLRIDDPTGGVAIHGVGAIVGLLLTPVFATGLTFVGRLKYLGGNLAAIAALTILAASLAYATWTLLSRSTKLRASEADEFDGLDLAEHDIGAYPDFQQTMIKSYHLREV